MISKFFSVLGYMVNIFMTGIALFLTFCMNVFTIPLYLLAYLFCKLIRLRTPRWAGYGMMLYPSWSRYSDSLLWDIKEIERKSMGKVKRHRPIRAWEDRFFR